MSVEQYVMKNFIAIMDLRDTIHELQLEVWKLKNPGYQKTELYRYEMELLKRRTEQNGTD